MELVFKVENGDVKMYQGKAFCGILGTLLPFNEEQFVRLLHRAVKLGEDRKAREIREAIGCRGEP